MPTGFLGDPESLLLPSHTGPQPFSACSRLSSSKLCYLSSESLLFSRSGGVQAAIPDPLLQKVQRRLSKLGLILNPGFWVPTPCSFHPTRGLLTSQIRARGMRSWQQGGRLRRKKGSKQNVRQDKRASGESLRNSGFKRSDH